MSKIITPTDSILIEIDNLSNPPRVYMKPTGGITNIGAIGIMSTLITQLAKDIVMGSLNPGSKPPVNPSAVNSNPGGSDAKTGA